MTLYCQACGFPLPKGRLSRTWNDMAFCNEYDQAAYMMRKGYAHWDSSKKATKCVNNHTIREYVQHMVYKKHRFCDLVEFAEWLRKNSVGFDFVVGEDIRVL